MGGPGWPRLQNRADLGMRNPASLEKVGLDSQSLDSQSPNSPTCSKDFEENDPLSTPTPLLLAPLANPPFRIGLHLGFHCFLAYLGLAIGENFGGISAGGYPHLSEVGRHLPGGVLDS